MKCSGRFGDGKSNNVADSTDTCNKLHKLAKWPQDYIYYIMCYDPTL